MNLPRIYRPTELSQILGQPAVITKLRDWLKNPESCAFIFAGPSGVGKTATARALAYELGIRPEAENLEEVSGLFSIASGKMLGEHVEDAVHKLRFRPMFGTGGWKMLIANECDRMTQSAENIWLDELERLPNQTVIVFTTNEPEQLTDRFRGRCELYEFEGRSDVLKPAIQYLCRKVWEQEVGNKDYKFGSNIGMPTLGGPECMHASFRTALQQLAPLIRKAKGKCDAEILAG